MQREEATVPSLTNMMTQCSISYTCVGSTHAARSCNLESSNEQKSFSKSEHNQRSLHPKTTNWFDGEKTVEALHSRLSLVVSLCSDAGVTTPSSPAPLDPPLMDVW